MTDHQLNGKPYQSAAEVLNGIAEYLGDSNGFDTYGEGEYLQAFEQEVADLFGQSAGVFMPSGTMAQQIALRIWCDLCSNPTIAMHPSAHLETAELLGYQHLHNLKRLQFGAPEFLESRILTLEDFQNLSSTPGAALLELPCRPLGGQLPSWDELVAISEWARDNGVALHMDGARVWQCRPHFGKSFAEIGALFDSIYVSFYKDFNGMFQVFVEGEAETLNERIKLAKEQTGSDVLRSFMATAVPSQSMTEVHVFENAMAFDTARIDPFMKILLNP